MIDHRGKIPDRDMERDGRDRDGKERTEEDMEIELETMRKEVDLFFEEYYTSEIREAEKSVKDMTQRIDQNADDIIRIDGRDYHFNDLTEKDQIHIVWWYHLSRQKWTNFKRELSSIRELMVNTQVDTLQKAFCNLMTDDIACNCKNENSLLALFSLLTRFGSL